MIYIRYFSESFHRNCGEIFQNIFGKTGNLSALTSFYRMCDIILWYYFSLFCCDVMFYCRSWVMFQSRCWRQCWCGRSWYCMSVTWKVMTTGVHTSLASPAVLRAERIPRWHQYVGTGVRPWLVGRSHQPGSGSNTRSSSSLIVSVHVIVIPHV